MFWITLFLYDWFRASLSENAVENTNNWKSRKKLDFYDLYLLNRPIEKLCE